MAGVVARGKPVALALMGLPGAGKTTLARCLAQRLRWPIIDRDALRAELFPGGSAAPAEKALAVEAVEVAVRRHLLAGESCIVDGMTFAARAQRDRLGGVALAAGGECLEVLLDCPVEVAAARVAADRDHPAPDRDPALVRAVAARFAPVGAQALVLEATLATAAQAAAIERWLSTEPADYAGIGIGWRSTNARMPRTTR